MDDNRLDSLENEGECGYVCFRHRLGSETPFLTVEDVAGSVVKHEETLRL